MSPAVFQCVIIIRTHQIRVHLQDRKTPILGDDAYGDKEWNKRYQRSHKIGRPLLHAYEMEFSHPFTGEFTTLRAPVPLDMQTIITKIVGSAIPVSQNVQKTLVDPSSGYLLVDTHVPSNDNGVKAKADKLFLPINSVRFDEDDWTTLQLPVDEEYFR